MQKLPGVNMMKVSFTATITRTTGSTSRIPFRRPAPKVYHHILTRQVKTRIDMSYASNGRHSLQKDLRGVSGKASLTALRSGKAATQLYIQD
jgi:hypothetical protein